MLKKLSSGWLVIPPGMKVDVHLHVKSLRFHKSRFADFSAIGRSPQLVPAVFPRLWPAFAPPLSHVIREEHSSFVSSRSCERRFRRGIARTVLVNTVPVTVRLYTRMKRRFQDDSIARLAQRDQRPASVARCDLWRGTISRKARIR